ncbi:hypothetical protein JTB14_022218, partial [Gonioctena quinquepunctata]
EEPPGSGGRQLQDKNRGEQGSDIKNGGLGRKFKSLRLPQGEPLKKPVGSIIPKGGPCFTGQECAAETIKPAASIVPEGGLILTGSIIPEGSSVTGQKSFTGQECAAELIETPASIVPEGESVPGQESAEESIEPLGSLFP